MRWLAEASAIAVGIAGGVYLAEAQRALRHRLGLRLLAYAQRVRQAQVTR